MEASPQGRPPFIRDVSDIAGARPPVSIVILAWNAWERTRACLDSLRRSVGPDDQVIVVDNGSSDATAGELAARPWVEVVTNEENHGFAVGCNDGAAVATRDVVVFLNNDTVVPEAWLATLLAPFADPVVAAVGPRSNGVSGPQLVAPVPYASPLLPEFERFARAWAAWFAGQSSEVDRLVGFCLAVRRAAFEEVDGFDPRYVGGGFEDDDLCRKLRSVGWVLRISHPCFVHHDVHATFEENDLDWRELETLNRARFVEKWAGPAAATGLPPA